MFTLINLLLNKLNAHEHSVLLIGLSGAGKTSLLEKLKCVFGEKEELPVCSLPPTTGLNIYKITHKGVCIKVMDIGGREPFIGLWGSFLKGAESVVIVVDIKEKDKFVKLRNAIIGLVDSYGPVSSIPALFVLNKLDLLGEKELIEHTERLKEMVGDIGFACISYMTVSLLRRECVVGIADSIIENVSKTE